MAVQCDRRLFVLKFGCLFPQGSLGYNCDLRLAVGWYRFEGAAGTHLPTSAPRSSGTDVCGTQKTAWLSQPHPTLSEGTVDRWICFDWRVDNTGGQCQDNYLAKVLTEFRKQ